MRKYRALIKMVFLDQLEYPAEVAYTLMILLPQLLVMVYLWFTVYSSKSSVGGFNLSQIITYYFLVLLIGRLHAHPAFWMQLMIERGELSNFITKPFSFLNYVVAHSFVRRSVNLLISMPILLIVSWLLKSYLIFPSSGIILFFVLSIIMSLALYYLMGALLGLVTFWTLEIGSLFYFFYMLLDFLGGATLPLSFFPRSIQMVLDFLPFKYLYYFPSQIFLSRLSQVEIIRGLSIAFFWVIVMSFITRFVWRRGLRRYSSFGG